MSESFDNVQASPERLKTLADGVFAIVMILLVFGLIVKEVMAEISHLCIELSGFGHFLAHPSPPQQKSGYESNFVDNLI